jgi:TetR/AcrR family transcriptional repressor of mexJK operon
MTARAPLDDRIRETREAGAVPVQRGRKAGSILAAARKLFLDHGFDAVAMDMVAQQAPVSKATLYAHFSSKEELFTAVVVDEAHRVLAEVWRVALERADIGDMLRHIAQKFVDIFLMGDAMSLHRAVIGVVPRFPAIGAAIFESGPKALTGRLAEFLAEAHRKGRLDIPNPPLAANQFLSLVRGDLDIRGLLLPATPPGRAEIEAQVDAGIDLFLRFYAPSDR